MFSQDSEEAFSDRRIFLPDYLVFFSDFKRLLNYLMKNMKQYFIVSGSIAFHSFRTIRTCYRQSYVTCTVCPKSVQDDFQNYLFPPLPNRNIVLKYSGCTTDATLPPSQLWQYKSAHPKRECKIEKWNISSSFLKCSNFVFCPYWKRRLVQLPTKEHF